MSLKFTNNAASTLAAGYSNSVTSMTVATGQGALFPTLSGSETFNATIIRASDSAIEIVTVTARATDVMTVTRAQEGTTGLTLLTGDRFELHITAAHLNDQNTAVQTHAATGKTTPVDDDEMPLVDSAASNVLKKVTWANIKATLKTYFDTLYAILSVANTWTKAQRGAYVVLTDASTVGIDMSLGNNFTVTLAGNRTFGVPTNAVSGQQGLIEFRQDATGSRTLAWPWIYNFSSGVSFSLTIVAGFARDLVAYSVESYASGAPTLTIATPCVVTLATHGLYSGDKAQLTTSGALPTGLAINITYWIHVIDANTFHLSTSKANAAAGTYIATTGSQSGTHAIVAGDIGVSVAKDWK